MPYKDTSVQRAYSKAYRQARRGLPSLLLRRARNRAFVEEINDRTFCAHCGVQPIEWHNPEHVELNRQIYRIGRMVTQGRSLGVIKAELSRCTPLCRRCHMQEDGRLVAFLVHARAAKSERPRETCRRGHPATPENTYVTPSGSRCCRICRRGASQMSRRRRIERARVS